MMNFEIRAPFLSEIIEFAFCIPDRLKVNKNERKIILRQKN